MHTHAVYIVTNILEPSKIYVGMFKLRNSAYNKNYLGSGKKIKQAVKELGRTNFNKTIVGLFNDVKSAAQREVELIEQLNPFYNIAPGGLQGGAFMARAALQGDPELRRLASAKISASRTGERHPMFGKKHSAEAIAKLRMPRPAARKPKSSTINMHRTANERAHLSAMMKGKLRVTNGRSNLVVNAVEEIPAGFRRGVTSKSEMQARLSRTVFVPPMHLNNGTECHA